MARYEDDHFVADGYERAVAVQAPSIQAEVEAEYADRLARANWWRRLWLRFEIRREIRRRLDRVAPPWGLYFAE